MKKLLILLTLINIQLFASELNLILGLNVTHLNFRDEKRSDYQLCEGNQNNLIGIEVINGKNSYALLSFTNSYYNESYSFNYHRIFKKGSKMEYMLGASFIKGYNACDFLWSKSDNNLMYGFNNFGHIVDDYSITPTFGINYNATKDTKFNVSVLGTAIITSVKVGL
jgi:hypothetical protein